MAPLHRAGASQASNINQLQIQHFLHQQHPLHKLYMPFDFKCDGCSTKGHGTRYRCAACDFDLHEECAQAALSLSSHLHCHQLTLVNRPGQSHFCDICGGMTDGLLYNCQACDFDVHPLCTRSPGVIGVPPMATPGRTYGYQDMNMMINQQGRQQGILANGGNNNNRTDVWSKVGKIAANVLVNSFVGVPPNFSSNT